MEQSAKKTALVGRKRPNPWGLHDLCGNVSEWVQDWWQPDTYAQRLAGEQNAPAIGDYRVVRGGSFASDGNQLRASARGYHTPVRGAARIGFRCARSITQ